MSDTPTADDTPAEESSDETALDVREVLTAFVEEHDALPDECTIFPRDADEDEMRTRWIMARGDAFVSLADVE